MRIQRQQAESLENTLTGSSSGNKDPPFNRSHHSSAGAHAAMAHACRVLQEEEEQEFNFVNATSKRRMASAEFLTQLNIKSCS
jgi:hypothetical protein